ncbi:hypothetical protein BJY16_004440 [Actinoplanes octamycinicus]|uniref:Uncharacterized protein n=1 Tax=Actinoplanes octamycinicus TaxID=135948 RepID=A0A7W7GZ53_9ACTN|nr:hypothetical protein [Actinoplanes octamycinicus]MBB4740981.1 hypothetical protein [Actinoplanes octamycinicus]GIE55888.1 hypothetical protein Aoc01nite_12900 [Actinoplanes octamycinicus]
MTATATRHPAPGGVRLDVRGPVRPALRIEAAGRKRFVLRQPAGPVLFGRVEGDWSGADYLRTGRFRSPIGPLRTPADRFEEEDDSWYARWAHHLATELLASPDGPLYTGQWLLSSAVRRLAVRPGSMPVARRWAELLCAPDRDELDWISQAGLWRVLPLRDLSAPDAGRVKAYRKQARAGVLPPVLLWWLSALECHVVLDGHDRLVAAIAEDREPPLLGLATVRPAVAAREAEEAVERYLTATVQPWAGFVPDLGDRLAGELRDADAAPARTRAWPLRGGSAAWSALVAAHATDWPPGGDDR